MTIDKSLSTTGIGSLPHHNIDAALAFSFGFDIPFLPQIPIRNPWEFMIPQALDSLPGLQVDPDGIPTVALDIWETRTSKLRDRLHLAFSGDEQIIESFEPEPSTSSSWQPFLWELGERKSKIAKVQIAGPLTTQWSLRSKDGLPIAQNAELTSQIYQIILAKALAMVSRLKHIGVQPIIYLDEPALYCLYFSNPKHILAFQELKLLIQSIKKAGATVGIHCCSNTHWGAVVASGAQIISLDASLSLKNFLETVPTVDIQNYLGLGGILSLGVISTSYSTHGLRSIQAKDVLAELTSLLETRGDQSFVQQVLSTSLFTPACGLALQTVPDAEQIASLIEDFKKLRNESLSA